MNDSPDVLIVGGTHIRVAAERAIIGANMLPYYPLGYEPRRLRRYRPTPPRPRVITEDDLARMEAAAIKRLAKNQKRLKNR